MAAVLFFIPAKEIETLVVSPPPMKKRRRVIEEPEKSQGHRRSGPRRTHEWETSTSTTSRPNLVIGDLHAHDIQSFHDTKVISFSKLTFRNLHHILESEADISLNHRQAVALIIGAEDFDRGMYCTKILENFSDTVSKIRKQNPQIFIIVCSLIHRAGDFSSSSNKIKDLNIQLQGLCKSLKVAFIQAFKPFLFRGSPIKHLYSNGGLYLNHKGAAKLTKLLQHALSPRNREKIL